MTTKPALLVTMAGWDETPWAESFAELLPDHRIVTTQDKIDPAQVHYAATWKHAPGSLKAYPNLKVIFSLGAGVDHVFLDKDLPPVPVVRVVDNDLTTRMSEWVVLHVLMHHRQQRMYDWQQHERLWDEDRFQPAARDIRVGVMGLGVLGEDAAKKLKVIGYDVAGWSRTRKHLDGIQSFAGNEEFDAFLARTDILVALMPLTPETKGILNRDLFTKLSHDGYFGAPILLNAGRGGLQNEADIVACLDDATLLAVTLDVFETEPLPQDSPLWHHARVTITPHNAAISDPEAVATYIANQIEAFEDGEPLQNVVDPKRQY
ncbi:2-hydroxyacid dehydrogenase [Methylovirgula sp. 4M-Z18]|uniref:2-hydroxyacid dehydrogenase n=1 Tax=Methylovirgula sp. 4M-Z18 TaxID=2293567 RepID=UPI000E2E6074|nr:glyoxylate/hydroxypyruvate reductase A [Methylovirgula sp. 4M-Z18]RFB81353.1 glyoxylate/hydroxypyruvate reductase A [Methylovirgula sp. 4M-Z18]